MKIFIFMKDDSIRELIRSTLFGLKSTKTHCFPNESVLRSLISDAKKIFKEEDFCVMIKAKCVVVGDIHGDIFSLIRIFETMGFPPDTHYLFLGDYVDRGHYSIEVMTLLLSLKVLYKDSIHLIRGNHETRSLTMSYGFYDECLSKANEDVYNDFIDLFDELPLVALLNGTIFCTHGGISKMAQDICKIIMLSKPKQGDKRKKRQIVHDLLWSDPSISTDFFSDNDRGSNTYVFGEKALDSFLSKNGLTCLIRGHQTCTNGYDQPFGNGKCWTVFSSADYCETWNSAAVLVVEGNNVKEPVIFDPITETEIKSHRFILPQSLLSFEVPQLQINPFICDISLFDELDLNLLVDFSL